MSSISRRSLLGYSGTAAVGAALSSAAATQPAQATEARAVQAQTETAAAGFPPGTLFNGDARTSFSEYGEYAELRIKFSVEHSETPASHVISPEEIAQVLNDYAASKGWPTITFYGTPAPAPLN